MFADKSLFSVKTTCNRGNLLAIKAFTRFLVQHHQHMYEGRNVTKGENLCNIGPYKTISKKLLHLNKSIRKEKIHFQLDETTNFTSTRPQLSAGCGSLMFPFHISYAIKMFNSILVNINYLQCWFFTWSVYDNALVSATLFWISLWKEAQHLSVHKGDNRQREPSRQWHGGKPHTSDTPQVFSDGQPAGAEALRQSATLCVQHRDTRFCLHSYTHTLNWCLHTTVSPNILPVSDQTWRGPT